MADQIEELDIPAGPGIGGLEDIPEGQENDEPLTEENVDAPGEHNEPLGVVTDHTLAPEDIDDPPPQSGFSFSSSENDEDADDEGAGEVDDEGDYAANSSYEATNSRSWQPQTEPQVEPQVVPIRAVLGRNVIDAAGPDLEIYRGNPQYPQFPYPYHYRSDSDSSEGRKERRKAREESKMEAESKGEAETYSAVRPSPLRTASSPDSPVSPKNAKPADDVGILPEPSPALQDEDAIPPQSDRETTPRPRTPTPLAFLNYAKNFNWSDDEDEEDTTWFTEATATSAGSRRNSETSLEQIPATDQPPVDAADDALSNQQPLSPVSPIDPVSEAEDDATIHGPDDIDEDSTAPEGYAPTFVGAEDTVFPAEVPSPMSDGAKQHANRDREISPTSPNFNGPEPLTGLGPKEGLEAWLAWRDRTRTEHRSFRNNRNFANQDGMGDLEPTVSNPHTEQPEAVEYLTAQRLAIHQERNVQQEHLQQLARHSYGFSEALRFDLASTQEYIKLRMLKYRAERNRYFHRAVDSEQRVGRREQQIEELDAALRETEQAYFQALQEKLNMEPVLHKERDKREKLKAIYLAQSEDLDAYKRAAERSSEDLRSARAREAKRAAPLQFSSIMEVASQEPVPSSSKRSMSGANKNPKQAKEAKQAAPLQVSSVMENAPPEPVADASEKPKQAKETKRAAPLQLSSIMEVCSQEPARSPPSPLSPLKPRVAPEHAANWPLEYRPRLVDFMTQWINNNRSPGLRVSDWNPQPIQRAQLNQILGMRFLSWDQIFEELRLLGYFVRPDHLANALADPDNIAQYGLPPANTAVEYAGRRLDKRNAAKTLLDEINVLQKDLKDMRPPYEWKEDLAHVTRQKKYFEKETQALNDKLDEFWDENERLRQASSNSSGIEDSRSHSASEEIRRLRAAQAALQADLEESQRTTHEILLETMGPDAPIATGDNGQAGDAKSSSTTEAELARCRKHGSQLKLERDDLLKRLDKCQSMIGGLKLYNSTLSQRARDVQGKEFTLNRKCLKLRMEIHELKAKLAAHDTDEAGKHMNDKADNAAKGQAENDKKDQDGSDALDRLRAAEQHSKDLQAKVDELQSQVDSAKKPSKKKMPLMSAFEKQRLAEIRETKAHRNSHEVRLIESMETEKAALHEALEVLRKENHALKEQADSQEDPLLTNTPAPRNPRDGGEEAVETLRRELAEVCEKNKQLEEEKPLIQMSLETAHENIDDLHEQVKPELPASERGLGSTSQGAENNNDLSQGKRAQTASAQWSPADLEDFVINQSDSGSEGSSSSEKRIITDSMNPPPPSLPEQKLDVASQEASPAKLDVESPFASPAQNDFSITEQMLGLYAPADSNAEDDDKKRADELLEANSWLTDDSKKAWKTVEALERELEKFKREAGEQVPSSAHSQKPSTRTAIQVAQSLPTVRQPVLLPADVPVATDTPSAVWEARMAVMRQSPSYLADVERRRAIRERQFVVEQERIDQICRRAAAIFGKEELLYVPVDQRYKPMVRAY